VCRIAQNGDLSNPEYFDHLKILDQIFEALERAVSLFCDAEKFKYAADIQRYLAKWNQSIDNFEVAITQYKKASSYYLAEKMETQYLSCLYQAALLMGSNSIQRYEDAARLFEILGESLICNNLRKEVAKECFFRSGLLSLALGKTKFDIFDTFIKNFRSIDPTFAFSSHIHFLGNLKAIIARGKMDEFADHLFYFCSIHETEDWDLELFEKLKKLIRPLSDHTHQGSIE